MFIMKQPSAVYRSMFQPWQAASCGHTYTYVYTGPAAVITLWFQAYTHS